MHLFFSIVQVESFWGGELWVDSQTGKLYSKIDGDSLIEVRNFKTGIVENTITHKRGDWALSPCGHYMATVAPLDSVIHIGEIKDSTLRNKYSYVVDKGRINSFSYSPDGRFLVLGTSGKGNRVYIWDWQNKVIKDSWVAHVYGVKKAHFSTDGAHVVTCGDKQRTITLFKDNTVLDDDTIKIWNTRTGDLAYIIHSGKQFKH